MVSCLMYYIFRVSSSASMTMGQTYCLKRETYKAFSVLPDNGHVNHPSLSSLNTLDRSHIGVQVQSLRNQNEPPSALSDAEQQ
jgi:hypothetical protein